MNSGTDKADLSALMKMLESMNERLTAIEYKLKSRSIIEQAEESYEEEQILKESSEDFEFRFGEQWFGKFGILAFMFAVFYLLLLPFGSLPQPLVLISGLFIALALIFAPALNIKAFSNLGGYLAGSGMVLLYLSVMRLHFFTVEPIVSNLPLLIILLFAVTASALYLALKRNSVYLTSLSFFFFYAALTISGSVWLIIPSLVVAAVAANYFSVKNNWEGLVLFSISLTYLVHVLWYLSNPIITGTIAAVNDYNWNILFIPVYMVIYALSAKASQSDLKDDYNYIQKTLINTLAGFGLFMFITLNSLSEFVGILTLGLSVVLLFIAAVSWTKYKSKFSTFIYSMSAYASLSAAILFTFDSPDYFWWLAWQSVAVVSTALWFRSKFIVVANFFIFISIIIVYFLSPGDTNIALLSFGLVALISARLININRERLELQSEQMRNVYLIIALLSFPYLLYKILPGHFVGISWIGLSFSYYIIGKIIDNKKYRLMASSTLLMSLVYIFMFGIISPDTPYKILSFLIVSVALIIISVVYAKVKSRESESNEGKEAP